LPKKYQVKKKKKFFTKTQENILNFTQISFWNYWAFNWVYCKSIIDFQKIWNNKISLYIQGHHHKTNLFYLW
jgi:hypothetical protein